MKINIDEIKKEPLKKERLAYNGRTGNRIDVEVYLRGPADGCSGQRRHSCGDSGTDVYTDGPGGAPGPVCYFLQQLALCPAHVVPADLCGYQFFPVGF